MQSLIGGLHSRSEIRTQRTKRPEYNARRLRFTKTRVIGVPVVGVSCERIFPITFVLKGRGFLAAASCITEVIATLVSSIESIDIGGRLICSWVSHGRYGDFGNEESTRTRSFLPNQVSYRCFMSRVSVGNPAAESADAESELREKTYPRR